MHVSSYEENHLHVYMCVYIYEITKICVIGNKFAGWMRKGCSSCAI